MIKNRVKMKVESEEQYLALQDLLFDNGIYWGGTLRVKSGYYGKKRIYIYEHGFTEDSFFNSIYFETHKNEEVDIDFYLKTKGTCTLSPLKRRILP